MPGHNGLGFRIFQHKLRSLSKAALLLPRNLDGTGDPCAGRESPQWMPCLGGRAKTMWFRHSRGKKRIPHGMFQLAPRAPKPFSHRFPVLFGRAASELQR